MGRTTIEGWMCGKKGWIYDIDNQGNIINKTLHEVPEDVDKFNSKTIISSIKSEYLNILN